MEEIDIVIDKEGNVKVSGKGIKGPDCVKLTAEIENAIGTVVTRRKTSEYHERPQIQRKVNA